MTVAVLVPAHNESAVIARTLAPLEAWAASGRGRIVVIANACVDRTADQARNACPSATVIETPIGGKTHAMNLGELALPEGPVLCLDADLIVEPSTLEALDRALRAGAAAACGRMQVNLTGTSPITRLYYVGWRLNPYHDNGKFGGLFGVGAAARTDLFPLPPVTADDEYVKRLFIGQIAFVPEAVFTARAPRRLIDLVRVRRRSCRGTRALRNLSTAGAKPVALRTFAVMLARGAQNPSCMPGLIVFLLINALVRFQLLFEPATAEQNWERDESSRISERC